MNQGMDQAGRQKGVRWRGAVVGLMALGAALLALAPPSAAATVLCAHGGLQVTEDMTLTPDGSPYLTCGFRVSAGTFTIEPGVRIEVSGNNQAIVFDGSARLVAKGTAEQPILFTRGGTELWSGLAFKAGTETPFFENVTIEHTGACGDCPLSLRSPALLVESDMAIKGCIIRQGTGAGIYGGFRVAGLVEGCEIHDMGDHGIHICCGAPSVIRGNSIHDNHGVGIVAGASARVEGNHLARNALPLRLNSAARPLDNTFDRNDDHAIEVFDGGNHGGRMPDPTLYQRNLDASGAPIVYRVLIRLQIGGPLTIEPGSILKFGPGASLEVSGGLDAVGTAELPILLTSASETPEPGDWCCVRFASTSEGRVRFENFTLEYADGLGGGALDTQAPMAIANCAIRHSAGSGVLGPMDIRACDIHDNAEHGVIGNGITLSDSQVHDNAGVGILAGHTVAVAGTSIAGNGVAVRMHQGTHLAPTNTFDGNVVNEIQVTQGASGADVAWPRFTDATTGQVVPYHLTDFGNYDFHGNLAIDPGNVVQFASQTSLSNRRAFTAVGTTDAPILFTSDQAVKAPGQWRGLELLGASEVAVLENVTIEAAGSGRSISENNFANGHAAIQSFRSAAVLKNCELRGNKFGLEILSDDAPVRVEGCTLRGHDLAVAAFPNANLTLRGNRIVGNDVGVSVGAGPPVMRADNNIFDNGVNAVDRQGVSWFMPKTPAPDGKNIIGNPFFGGNAWSDYEGVDCTGDGLGDTLLPYRTLGNGEDFHPLVEVGLDTVPPVSTHSLAATPGNNGWWRSAVTVTLEATDDFCGVETIFYAVDGGAPRAYTRPFVVAGDDVHAVAYWAEDRAGNVEDAHALDVPIDTTPPTVRLVDPVRGNVYVNDVGIPLVLRGPCAGTPAAEACGTFDLLAQDCTEIFSAACEAQPFDGMLPLTVLIGTKTLGADAEDATSGVAVVEFVVEGRAKGSDPSAPYSASWDTTGETLARHAIWAIAEDAAGNRAESTPERPITVPLDAALLVQSLGDFVADVDARGLCRSIAALGPAVPVPCAAIPEPPPLHAPLAAVPAAPAASPRQP